MEGEALTENPESLGEAELGPFPLLCLGSKFGWLGEDAARLFGDVVQVFAKATGFSVRCYVVRSLFQSLGRLRGFVHSESCDGSHW